MSLDFERAVEIDLLTGNAFRWANGPGKSRFKLSVTFQYVRSKWKVKQLVDHEAIKRAVADDFDRLHAMAEAAYAAGMRELRVTSADLYGERLLFGKT